MNDFSLNDVQNDSISSLSWFPKNDYLIASSWDGEIRCWNIIKKPEVKGFMKLKFKINSPILCTDTSSDGRIFYGACDNFAYFNSVTSSNTNPEKVAQHNAPIKQIKYFEQQGILITGSWDKTLGYWDPKNKKKIGILNLPEKVYTFDMAQGAYHIIIGCNQKKICIVDIRKPSSIITTMESPLKEQTRVVACFPDNTGFAIGSIEGRVSIRYHNENPKTGKKSFSFKCHRDGNNVYSVNVINFHPNFGTFATAGSDGTFNYWNKDIKSRLKAFDKKDGPISCGAFNKIDGTMFAYAVSYDWSKGTIGYKKNFQNKIYINFPKMDEIGKNNELSKNF